LGITPENYNDMLKKYKNLTVDMLFNIRLEELQKEKIQKKPISEPAQQKPENKPQSVNKETPSKKEVAKSKSNSNLKEQKEGVENLNQKKSILERSADFVYAGDKFFDNLEEKLLGD
jgi:hypothetical protein